MNVIFDSSRVGGKGSVESKTNVGTKVTAGFPDGLAPGMRCD